MMRRFLQLSAIALIPAIVAPLTSTARADFLDQSYVIPTFTGDLAVFDSFSYAQTFTVGLGGQLSRVGFQVYANTGASGPLMVEILSTTGGVPDPNGTAPLFETTIQPSGLPTFDTPPTTVPLTLIDVSLANIMVTPGEVLAIALRDPAGNGDQPWIVWRTSADNYSGGAEYLQVPANAGWVVSPAFENGGDAGFQTYVSLSPVPEPSSFALCGIAGAIGLFYARRRKAA